MAKGKTKSGFKFEVNDRIAEDWRLTLALADMDSGDESRALSGATSVVRLLLGKQEKAFYEHIKEEDGTVPTVKVWEAVTEILQSIKPAKKS